MDPEERAIPPTHEEFAPPAAVTRGIMRRVAGLAATGAHAALAGLRTTPVPVFAGAPALTVASMPAGSGAARDTTSAGPDASEPIRPRPHEIPHIEPDPGWNLPRPAHLPHPTYWPAVLAMGIVFFAWGLVTNPVVTAVGVIIFFVALLGWIGEMRHDS
jgi:hypothetical protein